MREHTGRSSASTTNSLTRWPCASSPWCRRKRYNLQSRAAAAAVAQIERAPSAPQDAPSASEPPTSLHVVNTEARGRRGRKASHHKTADTAAPSSRPADAADSTAFGGADLDQLEADATTLLHLESLLDEWHGQIRMPLANT